MKSPGSQGSSWHLWRPGHCCWSKRGFKRLAQGHMASFCARTGDLLLEALCAAHDGCWLVAVPGGRHRRAISVCFPQVGSEGWVQTPASGHFRSNRTPRSAVVHRGLPVGSRRGAGQESRARGVRAAWGRGRGKSWECGQVQARGCCAFCSPLGRERGAAGTPCPARPGVSARPCLWGGAAVLAWGSAPTCFHVMGPGLKPATFLSARKIKLWLFYGT